MKISRIMLVGCFVLAVAKVAAADELRVETGGEQNVIVRPDDNLPRPHHEIRVHEDHDADYWRHHHRDDDHRDAHVDIDINR